MIAAVNLNAIAGESDNGEDMFMSPRIKTYSGAR
jgi:hypothetical protein